MLSQSDGSHEIVVCFMPDPLTLVGDKGTSKAALAIDASASMREVFGFGTGPFQMKPNYVEAVARKLGAILTEVTKSGKSSAIYWAVSPDGSKIEEIGELDDTGWGKAAIKGPKVEKWGRGTKLLPAIQFVVEKVAQGSDWTMGVILTDGIIEDEKDCIDYCLKVGKQFEGKKPEPVKLILIGIGEQVDEAQLERFDDMFEGSGIDYDLWSSGLVASMENEADILAVLYSELMNEEIMVAPTGSVEDGKGQVLASWTDGLPGKFRFILPKGETKFVVKTPYQDIAQDVSEVLGQP